MQTIFHLIVSPFCYIVDVQTFVFFVGTIKKNKSLDYPTLSGKKS